MGDSSNTPLLPLNSDRRALAKILTVINEQESFGSALKAIQRIAVSALNEQPEPDDYWHDWLPDVEHL